MPKRQFEDADHGSHGTPKGNGINRVGHGVEQRLDVFCRLYVTSSTSARTAFGTHFSMAMEDEYKGYRVTYSIVSAPAVAPFAPALFHVFKKRGEDREFIHTGKVLGTFSSPQDAFRAAHAAARKWIDENGTQ